MHLTTPTAGHHSLELAALRSLCKKPGLKTRRSRYVGRHERTLDATQPSQDNILFGSPYDQERYEKGCETSLLIFIPAIS
jgi:hypothetical protein